MAITAEIRNRGESGDVSQEQLVYVVRGTDGDEDMTPAQARQAANDASPDNIGELWRSNISCDEIQQTTSAAIAYVTVTYSSPEAEALGGGLAGSSSFEFRYQAESGHIFRALATRAYTTGGEDTALAAEIHPHIKLALTDRGREPEGIELPAGNTTHVMRRRVLASFVSPQYQALVRSMLGGVNSLDFGDAEIGTVRFVSFDSSLAGTYMDMTWGFQYADNVEATVNGITYQKGGHEFAWDLVKGMKVAANILVPETEAIIVQQLFPGANLNLLGVL